MAGHVPGHRLRSIARLALATALALLTEACALLPHGPADVSLPATLTAAIPATVELTQVPFYAQEIDQCGPATLAMALTFAGASRKTQQLPAATLLSFLRMCRFVLTDLRCSKMSRSK